MFNDHVIYNNTHMSDSNDHHAAEEKKNLGNAQYKKGNYMSAVKFYSQALDLAPSEQILSNRAMAYIAYKDYKRAVDDCKAAIRINPAFARVYKRLFKAQLALGNIQPAKEALEQAVALDPTDATNRKDQSALDTVIHQQSMIEKFNSNEDQDHQRAVGYCDSILANCPASVFHICLKCEQLLKAYKLKEAEEFATELMRRPDTSNVPVIMAWCGRIKHYAGNSVTGQKLLKEALTSDPDCSDAIKAIKLAKTTNTAKDNASELFKAQKFDQAIKAFDQCL